MNRDSGGSWGGCGQAGSLLTPTLLHPSPATGTDSPPHSNRGCLLISLPSG